LGVAATQVLADIVEKKKKSGQTMSILGERGGRERGRNFPYRNSPPEKLHVNLRYALVGGIKGIWGNIENSSGR